MLRAVTGRLGITASLVSRSVVQRTSPGDYILIDSLLYVLISDFKIATGFFTKYNPS